MMNRFYKVVVFLLLFGVGLVIGWYVGSKFALKDDEVILNEETVDNSNSIFEKTDENNSSSYQEWINYILKQDIKSITFYKQILDENDSNLKINIPSYYINELTKDNLKEVFDSMNNCTIGMVMGLGGNADYIKIVYSKNNKDSSIVITDGSLIFVENDDDYKDILSSEVKDYVASLSSEERQLYGENSVGNFINNWNGQLLQKYFNKETAKTYYVE